MVVTAPVISSTVSPRTRKPINSPPICEGVASPDIMRSKAEAASSRERLAPLATLAMSALNSSAMVCPVSPPPASLPRLLRAFARGAPPALRIPGVGEFEKILQHQVPVLGGDALGMKLHAMDRQALMHHAHDQAVVGLGIDDQFARHAVALDHQRVVARGLERPVDAAEDAGALVPDVRELAVHRHRRAHHLAAEDLADGLMAEADAEQRHLARRLADQVEADAGLIGRAGAGREHDRLRLGRDHRVGRNLVVAMNDDIRPQPAQIVEQVEGEAVVIVDQDDHVLLALLKVLDAGAGTGQARRPRPSRRA